VADAFRQSTSAATATTVALTAAHLGRTFSKIS